MRRTAIEFLAGLALFVALDAGGRWLVSALHVPLPGSVLAMLTLTALVELGLIPMRIVSAPADLLVRHLALLYVPAGVAIISYVGVVRGGAGAIVAAGVASLVAVLLVVGIIVQRMERSP